MIAQYSEITYLVCLPISFHHILIFIKYLYKLLHNKSLYLLKSNCQTKTNLCCLNKYKILVDLKLNNLNNREIFLET